jgi:hypothetical protein
MHDVRVRGDLLNKHSKSAGRHAVTGQYLSVGKTSDGVTVLKSPAKPKHFTEAQAKRTVASGTWSNKP